MAHGADRVADLVGDAGAQAAQRRELRLLHLFGEQRCVLEEDQGRAAAAIERDEMRLQQAAAVGGKNRRRLLSLLVGVPAPRIEQIEQSGRDFSQQRARLDRRPLQELRRGGVDQPDAVVVVDHENALAQVLDDELIQLRQIRHVYFALAHALFALLQRIRQRPDAERHNENERADDASRREVGRIPARRQRPEHLLQ